MKKVFKYSLGDDLAELVSHEMPIGARFLTLLRKPDEKFPSMYFEVDVNAKKEHRQFAIYGTGHNIKNSAFIGTFLDRDGFHVWHVYSLVKK